MSTVTHPTPPRPPMLYVAQAYRRSATAFRLRSGASPTLLTTSPAMPTRDEAIAAALVQLPRALHLASVQVSSCRATLSGLPGHTDIRWHSQAECERLMERAAVEAGA